MAALVGQTSITAPLENGTSAGVASAIFLGERAPSGALGPIEKPGIMCHVKESLGREWWNNDKPTDKVLRNRNMPERENTCEHATGILRDRRYSYAVGNAVRPPMREAVFLSNSRCL